MFFNENMYQNAKTSYLKGQIDSDDLEAVLGAPIAQYSLARLTTDLLDISTMQVRR